MADGSSAPRLRRWIWDLRRFGFAPADLWRRVRSDPTLPRVLCVTLPKAGTHLVERLLCLHPALYRRLLPTLNSVNLERHGGLDQVVGSSRPGQLIVAHLAHQSGYEGLFREGQTRGLFMVRDPRDIAVSLAFYIPRQPQHPFYDLFSERSSVEERVRLAVQGASEVGFPSMVQRLTEYRGWLDATENGGMMTVRFEDLVGARGGGGAERQGEVVAEILRHLQVPFSPELLERMCEETFSDVSPTFRAGRIGGYREHFAGTDLEEMCQDCFGDLLGEYGYS